MTRLGSYKLSGIEWALFGAVIIHTAIIFSISIKPLVNNLSNTKTSYMSVSLNNFIAPQPKPSKPHKSKVKQPKPASTIAPQAIKEPSPISLPQPLSNYQPEPAAENSQAVVDTPGSLKEATIEIGLSKLPLDQDLYITSIEYKIRRAGELNYPNEAQYQSIKVKMVIDSQGNVKSSILKGSPDQLINDRVIDLIASANPYPKPSIINLDQLTIIRTFKFL